MARLAAAQQRGSQLLLRYDGEQCEGGGHELPRDARLDEGEPCDGLHFDGEQLGEAAAGQLLLSSSRYCYADLRNGTSISP